MNKIIWTKLLWAGIAAPFILSGIMIISGHGIIKRTLMPAALQNFLSPAQTINNATSTTTATKSIEQTPDRPTTENRMEQTTNNSTTANGVEQITNDSITKDNKEQIANTSVAANSPDSQGPAMSGTATTDVSEQIANSANAQGETDTKDTQKPDVPKQQEHAHVTRVIDGDTIVLSTGEHLRYIGINAPEISHDDSAVDCYGDEATKRDRELVEDKDVILTDGPDNIDIYGRLLRYVWVGDMLINQELIAEGDARANDYGHPHQYDAQFSQAELQAKDAQRGLWGACVKKTAKKNDSTKDSGASQTNQNPAVQINQSLVINEVRPGGDEFIEIYNPTDTPTSLAGYYFTYYSHTQTSWDSPTRIKEFPDDAAVSAHAFYLIAFGDGAFSSPKEDWRPYASDTLANSAGTVALFAGDPREVYPDGGRVTRIDAFGWGDTNLFEFAPSSDMPKDAQAFARPTDRMELDHNNNSFDFRITTITTPGRENILLAPQNDPSRQTAGFQSGSGQVSSSIFIAPAQVVISEVLVNGAEFVELYNPTAQPQSLTGHYLAYYSSTKTQWNDPLSEKKFPDGSSVPAHGYFLIDVDGGNYPAAQWTPASFSPLNNSYGTIAIFPSDPKNFSASSQAQAAIIDAVAWGNDVKVTLKETKTAAVPAAGQSISRDAKNDDTNDNSKDFFLTQPTPGNINSQSSDQNNSSQNAPSHNDNLSDVVINEIETVGSEFMELYNPSDGAVDLSKYFFAYYSSSKTSWHDPYRLKQFPAGATIPARGFYLIGFNYATANGSPTLDWQPYTSDTLSNTGGSVAIFVQDPKPSDPLCDILPTDAAGWGTVNLKETQAAPAPASGQSISRDASHADTDNNLSDFVESSLPTPTNSSM